MAKPMLVTLPGVLLLVDFWPLRRIGFGGAAIPEPRESWRAVLLEKIPFVALAGLFSAVTLRTQEAAGDFVLQLPLGDRLQLTEIDAAFVTNRDPLTGHETEEGHRPLLRAILMNTPAPVGPGATAPARSAP